MGLFKKTPGRPSNETIKKRNIFKGICALLVLVIVLLIAYILNYKQDILNNNKTHKRKINNISEKQVKKILSSYVYNNDYALVAEEMFSEEYKTILAISKVNKEETKYTCEELFGTDNSFIKQSDGGYYKRGIDKGVCTDESYSYDDYGIYSYDKVNEKYKELFGRNYNAPKTYVSQRDNGASIIYDYSRTKDVYVMLDCHCGGAWFNEYNHIYDYYEKNDELNVIFGYFNYGAFSQGKIVDANDLNADSYRVIASIDELKNDESDDFEFLEKNKESIFEKYKDKIPKYEIVFKKENNNYIFKYIEKVN